MSENRIVLLDESTANRIAAGEVVERPASAVKELVENAIDAGATQIQVLLEEGGKQRIVVTDNGTGMSRDDAILALQRHATSKIRTADDLFNIHTLGFRGEALPSIASVSNITLTTKLKNASGGICLRVEGGEIRSITEIASRDGTVFDISDLFYNTPARLKFLKRSATEVGRAVEVVGHLSIAYPKIAFQLKHGTSEIFATPGTGDPLSALAAVWGREIAKKLIPVCYESPGLSAHGFIATPDVHRPGRSHELFYVNLRPIKNRLLGHALEEAVRSLTPDSRYPIGAIFIEIDPGLVDVNVHPTKTEVKFTHDGEVHHAVSLAVKSGLMEYGIVPKAHAVNSESGVSAGNTSGDFTSESRVTGAQNGGSSWQPNFNRLTVDQAAFQAAIAAFSPLEFAIDDPRTSSEMPLFSGEEGAVLNMEIVPSEVSNEETLSFDSLELPKKPRPFADRLRDFRVIGQARNTYIIALTADGIAVIDQHVAHERVLFERLTVQRFSDGIPVQRLVVPLTLHLNKREALLLGEHIESFAISGWEIAPFGGESFVVRAIPAVLSNKPYERILKDMVDELVNHTVSRRLLVEQQHVTITNACKMAVKAGDPLSIPEMEGLLQQLAETENPYLCPHGRPIVVTVPFRDLDKLFKRS